MNCPSCGNKDADCVIGNYWKCPNRNCENHEEDTAPGLTLDGSGWAPYECIKCDAVMSYPINDVANGQTCCLASFWTPTVCGGLLRRKT
jgi:hypothetical protein